MSTDDYKKATGFTGGVKFGGGDTNADEINQPGYFGMRLIPVKQVRDMLMPAGTIIYGYMLIPGDVVPSAGTVAIGTEADPNAYLPAQTVTAPDFGDIIPVRLAVDTKIVFTGAGIVDGEVNVALRIVVPQILR